MGADECVVVHRQEHQQSSQMMSLLMNPIWWCLRPSTHDEMKKLSKWEEDDSSLGSSSSSLDNQQQQGKYMKKKMKKEEQEDYVEPGSPKIGCMGQIKHHKQKQNNKIEDDGGVVSTAQLQQTICRRSTNHCNKNKYFKLKNIFPATTNSFRMRNNVSNPNTTSTCNSSKILPRSRSKAVVSTMRGSKYAPKMSDDCQFNYVDMDPPLPVIKKPQPQPASEDEVSDLWKRRAGGAAGGNGVVLLKGLQIDKRKRLIIQHPVTM